MKPIVQKLPTLQVKRETLRRLDRQQLELVAAGNAGGTNSFCASHCLGMGCQPK